MVKSPDAFRTISEVADWLETPAHVLRFWESRFTQIKPVKRAGGRRYYRPADMALLGGIKKLLHEDGMTIRGAQKLLRERGVKYVASLSPEIEGVEPITPPPDKVAPIPPAPMAEMVPQDEFDHPEPEETVVPFARPASGKPLKQDATLELDLGDDLGAERMKSAPAPVEKNEAPAAEDKTDLEKKAFEQTTFNFDMPSVPPAATEADIVAEKDGSAPETADLETPSDVSVTPELIEEDISHTADEPAAAVTPEEPRAESDAPIKRTPEDFSWRYAPRAPIAPSEAEPGLAEHTLEETAPEEIEPLPSEEPVSQTPLGENLPVDPVESAQFQPYGAVAGQLNHRHLKALDLSEVRAVLARVEALCARLSE
ncbi:MerR family transcriptional regulator [Celeribacter litoreus]|uniref:MerR family transcriptional regulator n=1 Tax=Celeribacter litoreus TaxID=2876714 RepID=UPI001CCA246E|nr:MerR family transcriptional regulator [Celeribacter litoreus]MCA0043682.1 MerR family transcriptional regulator [Celeribacter litoreus]